MTESVNNIQPSTLGEQKGDILMLVHRVPYPPNKGDKIRSFNLLKFLASQGWRVHLCTLADDPGDLEHAEALREFCATVVIEPLSPKLQKVKSLTAPLQGRPLSANYFYRTQMQQAVDHVLSTQAVTGVLCFCSPMAEYFFRSKSGIMSSPNRPRLVMDLVDVDSDKWHQYAEKTAVPMKWVYQLESRLLAAYEQKVVSRFDSTILVSEDEAKMLRTRTGHADKIHGVANGVDLEYFSPGQAPSSPKSKSIVFCGAMDYFPNIDAVCWFAREVLPLIREMIGEVDFTIVGGKPTDEVKALGSLPGVRVTGRVEDVRPYVREADLSVAPIRIARGLQNKVLEAMAMAKAVLSTPEAFEGIEATGGKDLEVVAAEREAFAQAAAALLNAPAKRHELGLSARRTVEEKYCWESRLGGLEFLLGGNDTPLPENQAVA